MDKRTHSHRRFPVSRHTPSSAPLRRERARLRAHFRDVIAEIEARSTEHLTEAQREARAGLIRELARYARLGRFPRNLDFPGARVPYFVDSFGTRCAMAHLIESTGERALVARVAATKNNALVRELEADIDLIAWLERAGLTAAEAARIQPSYCFVTKGEACLCNQVLSPIAIIEGEVIANPTGAPMTVRVDAVHGDTTVVMTGQEIMVSGNAKTGERVLVQASKGSDMMTYYGNQHLIQGDETIKLTCNLTIPELTKEDAIDAMLVGAPGDDSACLSALTKLDPQWNESQCDGNDGDGGCALAAPGVGSPLVMGTLLVAAAALSRRRAVRRGRARRSSLRQA